MINELIEKLVNDSIIDSEKYNYFLTRTRKHIALVQEAAALLVNKFPEYSELLDIVLEHDKSKFEYPELEPYIELTWLKRDGQKHKPTPEILAATEHHCKYSKHHPEYWTTEAVSLNPNDRDKSIHAIDATKMPNLYLAEMVCDWQAMSAELKTNTVREWWNQVRDVRWHFSKAQEDLIEKFISVFEMKNRRFFNVKYFLTPEEIKNKHSKENIPNE